MNDEARDLKIHQIFKSDSEPTDKDGDDSDSEVFSFLIEIVENGYCVTIHIKMILR